MDIPVIIKRLFLIFLFTGITQNTLAQDQNFYIFLSFGQSNMQGNAPIEPQDTVNINPRFKVLQAVDCPDLNREIGHWYTAKPPLCRCNTGLTPVDYFGRTLVENLPENITIGVINVSVGGCKIELFNEDKYKAYVPTTPDWLQNFVKAYDGNPYLRLIEMAKLAQKAGVIKGILLHQGESNTNDTTWPEQVKVVYNNMLHDLDLKSENVPLLAGEVVNADQNGVCASMNNIIDTLPEVIPHSYVISSKGCTAGSDNLHFDAEGYRMLGKRYGMKMLSLLGYDTK